MKTNINYYINILLAHGCFLALFINGMNYMIEDYRDYHIPDNSVSVKQETSLDCKEELPYNVLFQNENDSTIYSVSFSSKERANKREENFTTTSTGQREKPVLTLVNEEKEFFLFLSIILFVTYLVLRGFYFPSKY